MAERPSLAFRALDAQVLGGHADAPALVDAQGTVTYAQLLHDSAAVAGALQQLGVGAGDEIAVDVPRGREQVICVLALARLGAVPRGTAWMRLVGAPPAFERGDEEPVPWRILVRAGREAPAEARSSDSPEYEDLLIDTYEDIFSTLTAGGTID